MNLLNVHYVDIFNWPGEFESKSRTGGANVFAKSENHPLLARFHFVKRVDHKND